MRAGGLKILVTNLKLTALSGTELHVRDVALSLFQRGHRPVVYAPMAEGAIVELLRRATIPVVSRLDAIGFEPDVIHGHHTHQTMAALERFPRAPGIFFCHSFLSWHDEPPIHPRILRYVAVDRACLDRSVAQSKVPEDRAELLLNWVDLARFRPRDPLPERPRRAVFFSNRARPGPVLDAVTEGCRRAGVSLDVIGRGLGRGMERPEDALGTYDVVFAKAKAAMEGIAVGAAVVLCDTTGFGGPVTSARYALQRENNFGARVTHDEASAEAVAAALAAYDAADAARVSQRFRAEGDLESTIDLLLGLYEEVIEEHRAAPTGDPEAERRAVAAYLDLIASTPVLVHATSYKNENERLRAELASLRVRRSWRRFLP